MAAARKMGEPSSNLLLSNAPRRSGSGKFGTPWVRKQRAHPISAVEGPRPKAVAPPAPAAISTSTAGTAILILLIALLLLL
jgi:hypothetical protein